MVLESNDRIQLALAKGLLEEAGIPFYNLGQITTLINEVDGFLQKWVKLQVPRDREQEARELLDSTGAAGRAHRRSLTEQRYLGSGREAGAGATCGGW